MMKMVIEASPEEREFLANYLAKLPQRGPDPGKPLPSADDPFYRLHELAVEDLQPLSNQEMDAIIYGCD